MTSTLADNWCVMNPSNSSFGRCEHLGKSYLMPCYNYCNLFNGNTNEIKQICMDDRLKHLDPYNTSPLRCINDTSQPFQSFCTNKYDGTNTMICGNFFSYAECGTS